jgi:hypothetical protein
MDKKPGFILGLLVTTIMGISLCTFTLGRAEEVLKGVDYSFDMAIGYHHANVNGYRGKVGEYDVLDPGMEGYYNLKANTRSKYFDLGGEIKDKHDQLHMLDFDNERIFQAETSYMRYKHYLDHDSLTNQDFFTDFDAGKSNSIIREEIKSVNTFRIPFIPNFKITADYRELNKRGHRQATTVSKCTQCHVTSRNRRISQTTKDMKVGAEMKIGCFTFNYSHLQRSFNEGGGSPIAYYGFETRSFPVRGFDRYSSVPDSRTYINKFRARADLPLQSTLYFDYEMGENHNRETSREREFDSFAFRLTTACLKYITFNFNYFNYDMDSDVPDAMERDVRRSGVSFRTRSWKKTFLRGSYRWDDIDRRNSAEESTLKKIFTLSLFSRPHRKVNFNIRYRNELIDDPFVVEQWEPFKFMQTSLPTRKDEVQFSFNWNPRGNLSLSSTIRYEDSESSRYYIDEERLEMIFSIWFAPSDRLMLTGSYSVIDTDINTRSVYKTYHREGLSDFLLDRSISYDDRSNCYNLTLNYRFSRKIALISNLTFTDSNADFDSRIDNKNIGQFSDLHIERLDASIGMDYLYKPNLSFYSKYNYRDYNDREVNDLDGEAHIISFGVNYTF